MLILHRFTFHLITVCTAIICSISCLSSCFQRAERLSEKAGTAHDSPSASAQQTQDRFINHLREFAEALQSFDSIVVLGKTTATQESFLKLRVAYKRFEHWVEYYAPRTADQMNGAPIDEFEEDSNVPTPATGLQVIETLLFDRVPSSSLSPEELSSLRAQIGTLKALTKRLQQIVAYRSITDEQIFDAVRLQIARISTLGLAGFDTPLTGSAIPEAAASIEQLQCAILPFAADTARRSRLTALFDQTLRYLQTHQQHDTFDHATFLAQYLNPLARTIWDLREHCGITVPNTVAALSPSAATVFDSAAFDAWAFAPAHIRSAVHTLPATAMQERITLGKRLFFDPQLSGNSSRACASCHQPDRAFTDGLSKNVTLHGAPLQRNTPTLLNAALQSAQFYDLRVAFLEDQAAEVISNPDEMHGSLEKAVATLQSQPHYLQHFRRAFAAADSAVSVVTAENIRAALAAYQRSLVRMNSPFDRFMRGDTLALSPQQRHGFNLFMGKAQCATCHFIPLFNGTVPPTYQTMEWEVIGVPSRPVFRRASLDPDKGREAVRGIAAHRYAFKTPSLRNITLTAPYMHNGVYATLDEVMKFYNVGGGAGIGLEIPNQTLPPKPLGLSSYERLSLVAFLHSLTDTTATVHTPTSTHIPSTHARSIHSMLVKP